MNPRSQTAGRGEATIDFNDMERLDIVPAGAEVTEATDKAAGTTLVSIRMPKTMVDSLKAIAAEEKGGAYQTLIKRILQRFIDDERRAMWNRYVAEQMKSVTAAETAARKAPAPERPARAPAGARTGASATPGKRQRHKEALAA